MALAKRVWNGTNKEKVDPRKGEYGRSAEIDADHIATQRSRHHPPSAAHIEDLEIKGPTQAGCYHLKGSRQYPPPGSIKDDTDGSPRHKYGSRRKNKSGNSIPTQSANPLENELDDIPRRKSWNGNFVKEKGVDGDKLKKKMIIQLDDRDEVELESGDLESESTDSEIDSESESEDVSAEGLISERPHFIGSSDQKRDSAQRASNSWPRELDDLDDDVEVKGIPAADLFAIDEDDVEMVSHASSVPPTEIGGSANEGNDMPPSDNPPKVAACQKRARCAMQLNNSTSGAELPEKPVKRWAKTSRIDTFSAERPIIKPVKKLRSIGNSRKKMAENRPYLDTVSPLVTSLGSKKIKLRQQPELIQDILHRSISKAIGDVLLLKTWPEENSHDLYGKSLLLEVCSDNKLVEMYENDREELKNLKKLIKYNAKFAKSMSDVVVDRLAHFRSPAKAETSKFIPYFKLGLGEDCKKRVASLMSNFSFYFPGSWGGNNGNIWQPSRKEAFLNPVVIKTIRAAYFSNPRAIGYQYVNQFVSSIPSKEDEKELPIVLVALIMTAIYSTLYEYQGGNHEKTDFDGNIFLTVNKDIFELLESVRESRPLEFHNRMHQLYKQSIDDVEVTVSRKEAAFSIIDFD